MIIEDSFAVSVPRELAVTMLLDIDLVAPCIPGLRNVRETEPDRYEATLGLRIGKVAPQFDGWLSVDRSLVPDRLSAVAEGLDHLTGSVAQVAFMADLEEQRPGHTLIRVQADVQIRGRLGQFGTGIIQTVAKEILSQFAACVDTVMVARASGSSSDQAATSTVSVFRIVWASLRSIFSKLLPINRRRD